MIGACFGLWCPQSPLSAFTRSFRTRNSASLPTYSPCSIWRQPFSSFACESDFQVLAFQKLSLKHPPLFSFNNLNKGAVYQLVALGICGALLLSLVLTLFSVHASSLNYPGGHALRKAHTVIQGNFLFPLP